METQHKLIAMPDGRDVEIMTGGAPDGLPFVIHEGTPVGLVSYPPSERAARIRGLRVIQIARPGYERSTPKPGRRVADIAADVAAVLDNLGVDVFVTAGWSGGGPHALACAALLRGRCLAAASIAGVAPVNVGLNWADGMADENVAEFGAAQAGVEPLTEFLDREAAMISQVTGDDVARSLGGLVSAVDIAVLTGDYADFLAAGLRAAVANGIAGWRDDDLAFAADWGFDLSEDPLGVASLLDERPARAPVAIWQGDQDRMVPFAHGQWLAQHIPGARVHLLGGEGHLSLNVNVMDHILDDLLAAAGLTA